MFEYAKRLSEVDVIIKLLPEEDYNKIPSDYIIMFNENANKDIKFKYDVNKTLKEQNVSKLTQVIIAILFKNYWATIEQKIRIIRYQHNRREELLRKQNY